ncbi:phenylalanine--tRNA ligase subunit alpha [Candidatus Micrarchaeota archaeon]|nr:MAG: phenylalanine--tRNA ligase subunit alpha [Candidatus Micrarchaeota archaeon]
MHKHEIKVLNALKDGKKRELCELSKITKLPEASVSYAISMLAEKKFVDIEEKELTEIKLSDEAREYIKKGFPERRLLNLIKEKEISLKQARKELGNEIQIALTWARKLNLATISSGKIKITATGRQFLKKSLPHEEMLFLISKGKIPKDKIKALKELEKRASLIELKKRKKLFAKITNAGLSVLKKGTREEVSQLNTEMIKTGKWKNLVFRKYDVKAEAGSIYPGKRHFVRQAEDYARKIWLEMGFKEMTGSLIQTAFWNFDALFTAQDHPVREMQDTFYVKGKGELPKKELVERVKRMHEEGGHGSKGWNYKWSADEAKKLVMRTHTTCLSAITLASLDIKKDLPAKYFAIGRCFRNETVDWSHSFEFNQFEGIVVDKNANFRHLLGYLKQFFKKMKLKARFRPAYFPYTYFSTEMEIFHPAQKQWIELGGAGIFRPEVVVPLLGEDIPVLAWGPGLDRIMMDYYKINDLRELYKNDIQKLRQSKKWLMG